MANPERDAAADRWTRLWGSLSSQQRRVAALAYLTEAEAVPAAREARVAVLTRLAQVRLDPPYFTDLRSAWRDVGGATESDVAT
jgi:hypothetical protein